MVTAQDKAFVQRILQMNYVTREQIQECLTLKKIDASKSIADILLEKRYLTQQQVVALMSQKTTSNNVHFSTGLFNSKILSGNTLFERYQVIAELGRGGMGIVYQAKDLHLQRVIALKMLLESNTDEIAVKRFLREAKTCAQLKHENLVELYDSNVEHGRYFFTMEYIEGQTLKSYAAENRLSTTQITEIMIKMCAGIAYAHNKGVIHRDLKPQNIMIKKNGVVKIMDFGLARSAENTKLSKSGAIVGTLVYMPPEQLSGKKRELDLRSDVYSLGAILYELLTGRPPFQGSYFNLLNYVLNHKPVPPSEVKPYVSKSLEAICLKAMEKDKHDRYSSVEKMIRDLKKVLAGEKIQQKQSWKNTKLSQVLLMVVVAACCFLIGWTSTENKIDYDQQSRHQVPHSPPQTIPQNIWQSCWKKSYFDFTESAWINLSISEQKKYSLSYQKWYAQQHNLNVSKTFTVSQNELTMSLIPPGKFFMGQKDNSNADNAQHRVTISQPFYTLQNKLDHGTLVKLLGISPSKFFGLSWQDAIDYCEMLGWTLPSEAQWEYMFRAGIVEEKFLTKDNIWGAKNFDHIGEWCFDQADIALHLNSSYVRTPGTYIDQNVDPLSKEGRYNIFRKFGLKRYTSSSDRIDVRPILPIVLTDASPIKKPSLLKKEKNIGILKHQSGTQNLIGLEQIGLAAQSLGWNIHHNRFIIADGGGKFCAQFILKKIPEKIFIRYNGLVAASSAPGLVNVEINNHILENRSEWPNTEFLEKLWCIDKSMLREGQNLFFIYYAGPSAHVWFDKLEITAREK